MSVKTQEAKMRKLAELLGHEPGWLSGSYQCEGPKRTFLNTGRAFLKALARDLELREQKVSVNPAGVAVSGDCTLIGMWESGGIYVCIEEACCGDLVMYYRTVRHMKDYTGGHNRFIRRSELADMRYEGLLALMLRLRKEDSDGNAA